MGFLREFLRNPRQTGSIAASSRPVVRMMTESLDLSSAERVVELGAGTGAVTEGLLRKLGGRGTLLAVELNQEFADALRRRLTPAAEGTEQAGVFHVANRSAVELPDLVRKHRLGEVDAISCSLPWTLMSPQDRIATLDGIVDVLAEDGQFVTLTCLHQAAFPQGRRLREMLQERFSVVRRQRPVWAAVPPMFAYHCTQPIKRNPHTSQVGASAQPAG